MKIKQGKVRYIALAIGNIAIVAFILILSISYVQAYSGTRPQQQKNLLPQQWNPQPSYPMVYEQSAK